MEAVEAAEAAFDQAHDAIEDDRLDEAEAFARQGLAILEDTKAAEQSDLVSEGWTLLAYVHECNAEYEQAIECCRRALKADPENPDAKYTEGVARLELWDFVRADELLAQAALDDDLRACATYERAVLAEAEGRYGDAEALFRAAASISPEEFPRPVRMNRAEARAVLEETIESLPDEFREALDNVEITVLDMPDRKTCAPDLSPLVLGVYRGITLSNRPHQFLPDQVAVFKRNIERFVGTRAELREELRKTLLHEIGHHLGFEEAAIEELLADSDGLESDNP
jgi:predicted Zn-dependent protease with MMP-like domain